MRAILVDDSQAIRVMLRKFLDALGAEEVVEASDGLQALAAFTEDSSFDLAVVDRYMPHMDGLQFIRTIRQNAAHRTTRMIMVTAEGQDNRVQEALEAGADEYLIKPFTRAAFREKLALMGLLED